MTAPRRAVVNPNRRRDLVVAPPPGDEIVRFHRRRSGYRPTPLHAPSDADLGAVWLKDESDRFGLPAFKILGASWAVERSLAADPGVDTLVAGSAGNHGRAVAAVASHRRLDCTIYVPATVGDGCARVIGEEGADVERVDGDYDEAVDAAHHAAQRPGAALIADTGDVASAAWVIDGYSTLFREVGTQTHAPFDVIMVPVGVGALAAAAVRHAVHRQPGAAVLGVEPATAACVTASLAAGRRVTVPTPGTSMTGLDCATPSAAAWPTLRDGLAGTVTITEAEADQALGELAHSGVTAGACGAATLAGLHVLREDVSCRALRTAVGVHRSTRVLCVMTEGRGSGRGC